MRGVGAIGLGARLHSDTIFRAMSEIRPASVQELRLAWPDHVPNSLDEASDSVEHCVFFRLEDQSRRGLPRTSRG